MSGNQSAALSFDIDSSSAQRAVSVLEALKATSIQVTGTTNQVIAANQNLTQSYAQERDALTRLATDTKTYDGTLAGLVNRLNSLRPAFLTSTADLKAFSDTLRGASAIAMQFNAGVDGLDRYIAKIRELNITTADQATGLRNMTAALQNQTVVGHQMMQMLTQLGVSTQGISANRPDLLMQRTIDAFRGHAMTAVSLQAFGQVTGITDPQAAQAAINQPYVPLRQQQQMDRTVGAQAQIDAQQKMIQQRTIELDRNAAELADLRSRFAMLPRAINRELGGGEGFTPDSQVLARLREISRMKPEDNLLYRRTNDREAQAALNNPMTRNIRELFNGTWSSNENEIAMRQTSDMADYGTFTGAFMGAGRRLQNLNPWSPYKPISTQDDKNLSDYDKAIARQQAGGVLAAAGDPSLQNLIGAQQGLAQFDTPEMRGRYRQGFGADEGNRRFENQIGTQQRGIAYQTDPTRQTTEQTQHEQFLMSLPPEQRARARAQIQYAESQGIPLRDITSLAQLNAIGGPNQGVMAAGTAAFNQNLAGQMQTGTEGTERQVQFQKELAGQLDKGRASAEDFTRGWSAFNDVLLASNDPLAANQKGLEAIGLALQQRVTQGKALVAQMQMENAATQDRLVLTRGIVNGDPITRDLMLASAGIEAERKKLVNEGQLPSPAGGDWAVRDAQGKLTGETQHLSSADAQAINNNYTTAQRTQRAGAAEDSSLGRGAAASDAEKLAQGVTNFMEKTGASADQAGRIMEAETAYQKDLAAAREYSSEADKSAHIAAIEAQHALSEATIRQTDLIHQQVNDLEQLRLATQKVTMAQLMLSLPLNQQAAAGAVAGMMTSHGGMGRGSALAFPTTNVAPEIQALLHQIQPGEGANWDTTNATGHFGPFQFSNKNDKDTWTRAAGLAGVDPADKSPANQVMAGGALAQSDYKRNSGGRDLLTDLRAGDQGANIAKYLGTTWSSMQGASEANRNGASAAGINAIGHGGVAGATNDNSGAAGYGDLTAAQLQQWIAAARAGQDWPVPGLSPEQSAAANANMRQQLRAQQMGVAVEMRTTEGRFTAAQASQMARTALAGQGQTGAMQMVFTPDPMKTPEENAQAQRIQEQTTRGRMAEGAAGAGASTTQETKDMEAQITALHGSRAALSELLIAQKVAAEQRASTTGIINTETRTLQLNTEQLVAQEKALGEQSAAAKDSAEVQRAVNAAGPFASPSRIEAVAARTRLNQQFAANPGLEQTPAGQQAIQDIADKQVLAQQTQQMQDLRDASHEAEGAITSAFSALVVHGERSQTVLKNLVISMEDTLTKTFVTKPFERVMDQAMSSLTGGLFGDTSSKATGGAGGSGGGGGILGSLFGGGGSGGAAGGAGGGGVIGAVAGVGGKLLGGVANAPSTAPASGTTSGDAGTGLALVDPTYGAAGWTAGSTAVSNDNGGGGGGVGSGQGNRQPTVAGDGITTGSLATGAGGILKAAAGGSNGGGLMGSLFPNGQGGGGIIGGLVNDVGGKGFYQGGGLIGSMFGGSGSGSAGAATGTGLGLVDPTLAASAAPIDMSGGVGSGLSLVDPGLTSTVGLDMADGFARGAAFPGNDNSAGSLASFEHQIVDRPTIFRYAAGGQFGEMGEAGPEVVMPLTRGPGGKLGIAGGGQQGGGNVIMNITTPDADSFQSSRSQITARSSAAMSRSSARNSIG